MSSDTLSNIKKTVIEDRPAFDLFSFMEMSQESRIGGATLERLERLWDEWNEALQAYLIDMGKISYVCVWLPEQVEELVDTTWKATPSEGFLLNTLAQYLCMSFLKMILPEAEDRGCAPSPRPTAALRSTLEELGVPYKNEQSSLLSRQYAVVTHYPYKGGCELCHLLDHCPKGQGHGEDMSLVLPGYEIGTLSDTNS